MGSIWSKEPAVIIGAIVAVVLQVIGALTDQGFVSELVGGRLTDIANALGALSLALVPVITAILVRGAVYSPASYAAKD